MNSGGSLMLLHADLLLLLLAGLLLLVVVLEATGWSADDGYWLWFWRLLADCDS
jgi:hypothetical protein